jgi:hypothetical protein
MSVPIAVPKALPSRASYRHRPRRVGGEFTRRQTHGQEATEALVSPWRAHAHAGPGGRTERQASRSIAGTIPTARAKRATTIEAQTTPPARRITPEKFPVSLVISEFYLRHRLGLRGRLRRCRRTAFEEKLGVAALIVEPGHDLVSHSLRSGRHRVGGIPDPENRGAEG